MKYTTLALAVIGFAAPATAFRSFADTMGGAPAPIKSGGYGPSKGPYKVAGPGVGSFNPAASAPAPAAAAPPPPPPAAPAAAAPAAAAPAASSGSSAPSVGGYLGSLRTESAPAGSGPATYLGALPQGEAITGSGLKGYLNVIGGPEGPMKPATYGPSGSKGKVGGSAPAAAFAAGSSAGSGNEQVLAAINNLNANMVRNQEATIGILQDINGSVKTLVSRSQ